MGENGWYLGFLLIAWISNYIHYKLWDEITYPFPNVNGCTVEVLEWINDFILHFITLCDYLSMQGFKLNHVSKRSPNIITTIMAQKEWYSPMGHLGRQIDQRFLITLFISRNPCGDSIIFSSLRSMGSIFPRPTAVSLGIVHGLWEG